MDPLEAWSHAAWLEGTDQSVFHPPRHAGETGFIFSDRLLLLVVGSGPKVAGDSRLRGRFRSKHMLLAALDEIASDRLVSSLSVLSHLLRRFHSQYL